MTGKRLERYQRWLATAKPGSMRVYHRGELARDAREDQELAALADLVRKTSTGEFIGVSECGHVRWRDIGTGEVALVTFRDQGDILNAAVRR